MEREKELPHEIVDGGQEASEVKDLLHQPFHGHYFTSAVHIVPNVEILLPNTEIPIIKLSAELSLTGAELAARCHITFSFEK